MKVLAKLMIILGVMFSGVVISSPNEAFAAKCSEVVGLNGKWYGSQTEADAGNKTGTGGNDQPTSADCSNKSNEMMTKVLTFVKILSALAVVFAVGMIIYGGVKYILSQGDPKATETAKQQIWNAGLGLFIVLTAFTILQLFMNASGL